MDSMELIYQKHARTVYHFLLSRTYQAELAEELTQETFYQAIRSINRFKGECSVSTWLCAIAKNVWKTYLQKHEKENPVEEEVWCGISHSAEEEALVNWDKVEILKMLHRLEDPIREVMYLRLIGNLSYREIGEIMDRTENWARVNFYRGKEKILQEVKKYEG